MRIAIDLMGGDNAPAAVAEGCALALQKLSEDTELVIFGEESAAKALIEEYELDMFDVRFVATTQQIGCDESPTLAIRKKKDSSLVRAVESVASGETDCVISAGSTGALLAGATFLVKRIDGVKRPALAVVLPAARRCCSTAARTPTASRSIFSSLPSWARRMRRRSCTLNGRAWDY